MLYFCIYRTWRNRSILYEDKKQEIMASQNTGIPKGTRDFSPAEMVRRNYIFDSIRKTFERYCYQPIETPAMENLTTLLGKYGDEGDKLLFKILNSGENVSHLAEVKHLTDITEKGLRYDLTVPFARYVVQHRNDIVFPFKRYQIQPVWRADKPQKGRYREFYQCDADVIGSNSLLNEVELIQMTDDVFGKLGVRIIIKFNNRKILTGIIEQLSISNDEAAMNKLTTSILTTIDKLDKVGIENVNKELEEKGITKEGIDKLQAVMMLSKEAKTNNAKLERLKEMLKDSVIGMKGIEEAEKLLEYIKEVGIKAEVEMDLMLARGLNYYTGTIIEVKAGDVVIGSICGGGRYDDLTGIFGMKDVSGVGISFGADRIYDVMNELKLFPADTSNTTQLLIINFGGESERLCLGILKKIREAGVNAEFYPSNEKINKQMQYANKKNIPKVILVGEEELKENRMILKDMTTGEQKSYDNLQLIIDNLQLNG